MPVDAAAEEQFGPYLVYERLGIGGMATVHRALEQGSEGFERTVALKRLLPHLAEDASFIKSFVREAKLASILNHVNIVQIYELGRVGTEYFISMEYIDGRDLRRVLRHARKVTGPPPINITVGLMLQLCDALDYAHNKVDEEGHPLGLVHRDISPSNLLITSGGHLKIIDFGIAKAQSSQLRTQTGRVKGKLAYMAPEAVAGSRDLDSRSDIWATGVIIHELLTARPLFASKNEYQTLLKVQRGDILPPSTFNQGCPPELDALVGRALERDPEHRYTQANELREALLDLKRRYALQTGYRDIAAWLDWAFGLEHPSGFSGNTASIVMSVERHKTPVPGTKEEDEAVDVVWGAGAGESEVGPVVLEEVPDVSQKHRVKRDTEDDSSADDDIPTPLPSHGTMPTIYGTNPNVVARSDTSLPARAIDPAFARGTDPPYVREERKSDQQRAQRTTSPGVVAQKATGPRIQVDTPQLDDRLAAQRARNEPPVRIKTDPESARTDPFGKSLDDDALFGIESDGLPTVADEAALAATAEDDSATTLRPSDDELPVVRFVRGPLGDDDDMSTMRITPASGVDESRPAGTKPGFGPPAKASTRTPRPAGRTAPPTIGAAIAARASAPRRTWLYVIAGLALAGGIAMTATLMLGRDEKVATRKREPSPPSRAPAPSSGTIKFVTEPGDAEILIAGQVAHTGSPWSSVLAAGVHQIEIHRAGYKAWLTSVELSANETQTLRVVLEPLAKGTNGDASLTITTTPSSLEVVVDGKPLPQRTPIKTTITVGPHKLAIRQNGVELWHQTVDAEASSDYEFSPSFTEDKLRERTQRAAPAPAPPPTAPATPAAPPSEPAKPSEPALAADKPDAGPPAATAVAPVPPSTPAAPIAQPIPAPPAPPPPAAPLVRGSAASPPPKPAAPAVAKAPLIVPPSRVTKVSGDPPSIEKFRNVELPNTLAAKVCTDETGKITSVEMVTKVERRVAADLVDTLRRWRYAPYLDKGTAVPVCFVVPFRVK